MIAELEMLCTEWDDSESDSWEIYRECSDRLHAILASPPPDQSRVEAVARELCKRDGYEDEWDEWQEETRESYREDAARICGLFNGGGLREALLTNSGLRERMRRQFGLTNGDYDDLCYDIANQVALKEERDDQTGTTGGAGG